MVILLAQNYTMQTPTPILNAKIGEHYARLMHLSLMLISFDIRPEDEIEGNIDIWVDVQAPPILSLCEFLNHIYVLDIVNLKIVNN